MYTGLSFTPTDGVAIIAVIVPSLSPLQVTGVDVKVNPVTGVAALKFTVTVSVQLTVMSVSLTKIVCEPEAKPGKVAVAPTTTSPPSN
jgi:multisubunit Na+/H+ antiporter MnhE subunit